MEIGDWGLGTLRARHTGGNERLATAWRVAAYPALVSESGPVPERAAYVPLRPSDGFLLSRQYLQNFLLMP